MPGGRKQYGPVLSAAVFAILEIAAIIMLGSSSSIQATWLKGAAHRTHATLWGSGEKVRNYFTLDRQNRALAAENVKLSNLVRDFSHARYLEDCLRVSIGTEEENTRFLETLESILKK